MYKIKNCTNASTFCSVLILWQFCVQKVSLFWIVYMTWWYSRQCDGVLDKLLGLIWHWRTWDATRSVTRQPVDTRHWSDEVKTFQRGAKQYHEVPHRFRIYKTFFIWGTQNRSTQLYDELCIRQSSRPADNFLRLQRAQRNTLRWG